MVISNTGMVRSWTISKRWWLLATASNTMRAVRKPALDQENNSTVASTDKLASCTLNGKGNALQFIERKSNDALVVVTWVPFTIKGEYLPANVTDSTILG